MAKAVVAPKSKKPANYTSADIDTQRFPESVRANASMYIGGVDAYGRWTTTKELLDNGADEFMAGRNSEITLYLEKDGSYWVWDSGHGIPQGVKKFSLNVNGKKVPQEMPTMQAVFGELHTSGKTRSDAYAVSIGTHGIGAKATNATADVFKVTTFYEGKWHSVGFEKGHLIDPVKAGVKAPKLPTGITAKKGTVIYVKPDESIFTVKSFPPAMAVEWAEIMAYMNPGLKITIQSAKSKKEFLSKIGPKEYIDTRLVKLKTEAEKIMFVYKDDMSDIAVAFATYDGCDLRGMTNSVTNNQGGKHVDSVTGALYEGIRPFIKTKKVDGVSKPVFREQDFKDGLVGLVNAKLHKAMFSSQDKAKLVDERVGKDFEATLIKATTKFFKENKALAQRLCERATKISELRQSFTLSKKGIAKLNAVKRLGLPAKYAGFDRKTKVEDRELFLVEGDSAAGKLKEARFPFQAVLPLKGKILNVLKDKKQKAMESEEVVNILAAIGYDAKAAEPMKKLVVGKIICMADPDPDGPFVGDTKIKVIPTGEGAGRASEFTISELAEWTKNGQTFEVPVWSGKKVIWAPATAALVRNVDELVAIEVGKHKYKVSGDHKFMVVRTPATRDRELAVFDGNSDLAWIEAREMRIGDRMYFPEYNDVRRDWTKQDKNTGLGFLAVNKLRIQKQAVPVPVYCLTVPRYHHFLLPSGLISANCHINSLLMTLFYKYLPELFERGMIYVSSIPEFYAIHKGKLVQEDTVSQMQTRLKAIGAPSNTDIRHIKGWGEVGKNLLRIMACDPSTRRLIKIQAIESSDHVEFAKLMNDDVEFRRNMLGLPQNAVEVDSEAEEKAPARKVAAKKVVAKPAVKKVATNNLRPQRKPKVVK